MESELWCMRLLAAVLLVGLWLWRQRALRAEAVLPAMDRDSMLILDLPSFGKDAQEAKGNLGLRVGDAWKVSEVKVVPGLNNDWLIDVELSRARSEPSGKTPCEQHSSSAS